MIIIIIVVLAILWQVGRGRQDGAISDKSIRLLVKHFFIAEDMHYRFIGKPDYGSEEMEAIVAEIKRKAKDV